ncbi:MAG: hypothetical protein WB870_13015 [Gallionellaceae bacterium]
MSGFWKRDSRLRVYSVEKLVQRPARHNSGDGFKLNYPEARQNAVTKEPHRSSYSPTGKTTYRRSHIPKQAGSLGAPGSTHWKPRTMLASPQEKFIRKARRKQSKSPYFNCKSNAG